MVSKGNTLGARKAYRRLHSDEWLQDLNACLSIAVRLQNLGKMIDRWCRNWVIGDSRLGGSDVGCLGGLSEWEELLDRGQNSLESGGRDLCWGLVYGIWAVFSNKRSHFVIQCSAILVGCSDILRAGLKDTSAWIGEAWNWSQNR